MSDDKDYPTLPLEALNVHANLLLTLTMMKQELNWLYFGVGRKFDDKKFDRYWQGIAERTRELLYIAKQSMGSEDYIRFKELTKMTIGAGYSRRRIATGQVIKNRAFIDFD